MEKGKIIVIEGTDCSGKETQSKLLIEKLNNLGKETKYFSFPAYSSPTGKIVGLSYLGKPYLAEELIMQHSEEIKQRLSLLEKYDEKYLDIVLGVICESLAHGWFPEGAPHVDSKISSLYYAADRAYNIDNIKEYLNEGINVILDRYVYSNMAHQGGKGKTPEERKAIYEWLFKLEFEMMGLPEPDVKLFLHMPTDFTTLLKQGRTEALDENEKDLQHLKDAERAYLEVASQYGFEKISCIIDDSEVSFDNIKTPQAISEEVYETVSKRL